MDSLDLHIIQFFQELYPTMDEGTMITLINCVHIINGIISIMFYISTFLTIMRIVTGFFSFVFHNFNGLLSTISICLLAFAFGNTFLLPTIQKRTLLVMSPLADRYPFYDIILNYPDNKHLLFSAIGLFLSYMYSMSAGVVNEGELGASFILQHKYFKSMLAHIALFFFLLFTEYVLFPDYMNGRYAITSQFSLSITLVATSFTIVMFNSFVYKRKYH